ncbi:uncharacterized protein BCR38DRAFT_472144 [Pseudomassariella vexata]|uniref:Uncharacterized protein n=1 Tax=Pseudomassariella vexata TaxID=1141098 RepID=A0A1Y2EAM0_9PEZI|nr:uncharacterized protein BCR38DRAFT_472144 [Pseudomassariella vexata]ORY68630.1 hypothetical protein BCR38DRAFT_472144 [Pseudomassariella vexata]
MWNDEKDPGSVNMDKEMLDLLVKERRLSWKPMKTTFTRAHQQSEQPLQASKCSAEKINIQAVVTGYESGQIAYSEHFTLIYAGYIVDTSPAYEFFAKDREERLNWYFSEFGEG